MPALDDVTQRFIADTAPYVAALQAARDAAYQLAVANQAAVATTKELQAAMSSLAEQFGQVAAADMIAAGAMSVVDQRLEQIDISAATTAAILKALGSAFIGLAEDASVAAKTGAAGSGTFGWVQTAVAFWNQWKNVIHWAVMGTLEILSTAVPALIALGAAMAAMYPTIENLKDHFSNLIIAAGGFHNAIGSMGGPTQLLAANMQKLNLAVAPNVWMIFGSAISIATSHTGTFAGIAQQASNVLGGFATKIVTDLAGPAGAAMQDFFNRGVQDMTEWGQVLGQFGHAFLNVMHAMPGVGNALLLVLDQISKVFVALSGNPVGAFLLGLVATFSALYRYITFAAGAMAFLFKISGIQAAITFIGEFVAAVAVAATETSIWNALLLVLQGELLSLGDGFMALLGPLAVIGAVLLPGVAVALLEMYLSSKTAKSGIEDLIIAIQKLPPTTQNLAEGIVTLSNALRTETSVQQKVNDTTAISNTQAAEHGRAVASQSVNVNELSTALTQQYSKLKQVSQGLQALGYNNSQTTQDMMVLSIQIGLQDSKVQQLNQAWDSYLGIIVGGESSLSNFATTLGNMLTVAATSGIANLGRQTGTFTVSLQQFQQALAGGPFGSSTGAAAWQNFSQMFSGSAQQIADWARTTQVAGAITKGQFRSAILDTAEIMSQFTGSTGPAAAAVLAFAKQGDPAITTMQQLNAATGGVDKAEQSLNGTIAQGTINMTNASKIAQNLSAIFNTQVANAITAAALKASGFDTDIQNMMQAQQTGATVGGKTWQQWATMAQAAMNGALATAQKDTAGITGAWSTVPRNVGTTYTVYGQVVGNVPAGTSMANLKRILGGQHGLVMGFQGGGMVGGPGGVDAVPAMLTAGEAVLNARAVAAMGGPLGVHTMNNQPSEAVLTTGGGGSSSQMAIQNHITVELDGKQLTSAWRVNQLTYDRRNPGPSVSLNRPGRPG